MWTLAIVFLLVVCGGMYMHRGTVESYTRKPKHIYSTRRPSRPSSRPSRQNRGGGGLAGILAARWTKMAKEACEKGAVGLDFGVFAVNTVKKSDLALNLVKMVNNDMQNSFAIAVWTGRGGVATGHFVKFHIECEVNGAGTTFQGWGANPNTRGYDVYVWAPKDQGTFTTNNGLGYDNWAMGGMNFKESWRTGPDRKTVVINNIPGYMGPPAQDWIST